MGKKPTSHDVAQLAGVSQSTVSMVLNQKTGASFSRETIDRVLDAARKLEYRIPAVKRSTAGAQPDVIGVLVPTLSNPYYPMLVQSIEQAAAERGFHVLLCNTRRDEKTEQYYLNLLGQGCVRGIIYCFTPGLSVSASRQSSLPTVVIGEKDDRINLDTVGLHSFKAGVLVADHLISLGHHKMAFVSTPLQNMTLSRKLRLDGIRSRLQSHGLETSLIIKAATSEQEQALQAFELEAGYHLTRELMQETDVTAIIAVNDITACGVLNALNSLGCQVPGQVSVCGFDNILLASASYPGLTTIDHSIEQRARTALDILMEKAGKLDEQAKDQPNDRVYKIEYEPRLIVRASTGPAPGRDNG